MGSCRNDMTLYAVQTTIRHERHGCTTTQQLPTFYLDYVLAENARQAALDILSGWNDNDDTTIDLTVAKVS